MRESLADIKLKKVKLSNIFNSNVDLKIDNGPKNLIISPIDITFEGVARRFFHERVGVSSNNTKHRTSISFIITDTQYPHKEILLNKKSIAKILKTNYIIHSYNGKPCLTYFLLPNQRFIKDIGE